MSTAHSDEDSDSGPSVADLYSEVFRMSAILEGILDRVAALESRPPPSAPAPALPTVPAVLPPASAKRAKPKKGKQPVAPTATPTVSSRLPATPAAIQSVTTKAALEKTTVTLQIQDAQAGHLVGRAGNGLREVHDFSRAKVSVAPASGNSGLRSVTIRGSVREVGDALTAIGKRLARRRVRKPRAKGKKKSATPSAPTSTSPHASVVPPPPSPVEGPPTPKVVVQPPTPTSSGGLASSGRMPPAPSPMQLSTPAAAGGATPSPMQMSTPSLPPTPLPPGSPMEVDALRAQLAILQAKLRTLPPSAGETIGTLSSQPAAFGGSGSASFSGPQTARRGRPFRGR
jgi:hypothetical protein